jgi:hypothetical protein
MLKRGALSLIADIVAAVCHRRSSDLSSGFGFKNNSHSGKANGSLALLPSLVIPPWIEQMSRINSFSDPFDSIKANGEVGAPDDSIRPQQGWVKNQDSAPDWFARYVNVWDRPF